jgi:S-disulfanyl-L-cysteine oxidoreductase SoxD
MPRAELCRTALATLLVLGVACRGKEGEKVQQQGRTAAAGALPADVRPTPALPAHFGTLGREPTRGEIQTWNIDVNPEGEGLPAGRGTSAAGAAVFAQKCASCHGAHGEGMGPIPRLVGREPRTGFPFGQDVNYVKTIGNYWPYATTVYDYVQRAMPLNAPGSLRPDEIYGLVAFLLAENEIVDRSAVLDSRTLPRVRMPARDRFVVDDRHGGPGFR